MRIDLKALFIQETRMLPIDCEIDLAAYGDGDTQFASPAHVTGEVISRSGIVTINYNAVFLYERPCDRCFKPLKDELEYSFSHVLLPSVEDENDIEIIVVPDYVLDLDELVYSDILLGLPIKYLCSEDCRGLCQYCGTDLNEGDCDCEVDNTDPRLAVLRELL